jgi:predicted transcriptional regulator
MRTTLTLEDDLADRLAQIARETQQPFKVVVNETLRRGLAERAPSVAAFAYQAHAGNLLPGIDERHLNELAWQLDEERFRQ